jgi:hypothetical protein
MTVVFDDLFMLKLFRILSKLRKREDFRPLGRSVEKASTWFDKIERDAIHQMKYSGIPLRAVILNQFGPNLTFDGTDQETHHPLEVRYKVCSMFTLHLYTPQLCSLRLVLRANVPIASSTKSSFVTI